MRTTTKVVAAALLAVAWRADAQSSPAAGATAAATDNGKRAIEEVHAWALRSSEYAKVAAEKATSPKLKQLGSEVLTDSQRIEQEAQGLAKERGIQLSSADTVARDARDDAAKLRNAQPSQIDATLAQAFAGDRAGWTTELKRLRDETPGKDAKLKGWLDKVEDTVEKHSNDAFAARREVQDTAQRQGRAPAPPR